jgi:glutamate racemase
MGIEKGGVAFFDSGIGGLTVVNACRKWLPNLLFYYYGDNKHAPYGNLSPKKIKKYVFQAFKRFEKLQVGAVVVACNTATAVCIDELRSKFKFPIIGAEPAVLLGAKRGEKVAVLTTRATYESPRVHRLRRKAERIYPFANIEMLPCDKLAGEIERHVFEKGYDYTNLLPNCSPEVVVLGCTHYIYIAKQIEEFYKCPVVDGNEGIARRLTSVLYEKNHLNEHLRPPDDHNRPNLSQRRPLLAKFTKKSKEGNWAKNRRKPLLEKNAEKSIIRSKQKGLGDVVFLGKDKKRNKNIYEHLFL